MFSNFLNKARQVAADPVLWQWLLRRLTGGVAGPERFTAHRPPYLEGFGAERTDLAGAGIGVGAFHPLSAAPPVGPIELPLAGTTLKLNPGDEHGVFQRDYDDVETLLAQWWALLVVVNMVLALRRSLLLLVGKEVVGDRKSVV